MTSNLRIQVKIGRSLLQDFVLPLLLLTVAIAAFPNGWRELNIVMLWQVLPTYLT
jgi:hypothetical protein